MLLPNPIDKRLDFVRKQYGQETYEKTRKIVAANLGIAESEIAPGQRVDWEKFIPWLGKQVHKLLKRGPQAAPELKRLETGFLHSIEPFMVKKKALVLKEGKVVKRRPELERLSPKRARQIAGRQQERLHESRVEQARRLGYKKIAGLGNGYTAVIAVIDPKMPYSSDLQHLAATILDAPEMAKYQKEMETWVAKHAPFQQWLGVELGNCLQFYRVNYEPHGKAAYDIQREGGKLYGILDPKGKPVAAILTESDGSIRETNGPGNRPPAEKDQEYVDRFIIKHLKQGIEATAFRPPANFPPHLKYAIEAMLDVWPENDIRGRRRFFRKIQGYARQQGAVFVNIWKSLVLWVLIDAPDSVLKRMPNIKPAKEAKDLIRDLASAVRSDSIRRIYSQLSDRSDRAYGNADDLIRAIPTSIGKPKTWSEIQEKQNQQEATKKGRDLIVIREAMDAVSDVLYASDPGDLERISVGSSGIGMRAVEDGKYDFANKFLELMRNAARTAGAAPGPAGNPTGARALVRDCRATWEAYCEKPGKTRLKKVFSCLKKMETSKAATVKSERTRCLRSARAEKRKHKWDF